MTERHQTLLLGLPFDTLSPEEVSARIAEAVEGREKLWISTANLDWVVTARTNEAFRRSILASDIVTCDGAPVMILARIAGRAIPSRVTGVEIFRRLRAGEAGPMKVGFFGAEGDEAERASQALNDDPSTPLTGVGGYNPGHGSVEALSADEHIDAINAMGADILVMALGAVKAQEWIGRNIERLNVPVVTHLGAVVRHTSGDTEEAPEILAKTGFEWVYRAVNEPALRKRYASNFAALPGLTIEALKTRFAG